MRQKNDSMRYCCLTAIGIILLFVLSLLTGCKSSGCTISENDMLHDTLYISRTQHDSIYLKDSIYIREYLRGDTVHVDRVQYKLSYRDRLLHDTCYIHKTDTIIKTITMAEKKPTFWQRLGDTLYSLLELIAFAVVMFCVIFFSKKK